METLDASTRCLSTESQMLNWHKWYLAFKTDSRELGSTRAAVADGCVSTTIGNFLFFSTAHFCSTRKCQMQLV